MSLQGILATDLFIAAFALFVVYLLLRGKIYVGYAVLWLGALLVAAVLVTVEPLQFAFTRLLGAVFPASALTLAALVFIILLLIYFTVQVTILGDRVTQLAQHIALSEWERESRADEPSTSQGDG